MTDPQAPTDAGAVDIQALINQAVADALAQKASADAAAVVAAQPKPPTVTELLAAALDAVDHALNQERTLPTGSGHIHAALATVVHALAARVDEIAATAAQSNHA